MKIRKQIDTDDDESGYGENMTEKTGFVSNYAFSSGLICVWPEKNMLPAGLEELLDQALQLLKLRLPPGGYDPFKGVVTQLEYLAGRESDPVFRGRLAHAVKSLRAFISARNGSDNSGKTIFLVSSDRLKAFLTLIPPGEHGDMPTINTVVRDIAKAGIVNGVNEGVVEKALKTLREANDIVWRVPIAEGQAPGPVTNRRIRFDARTINKPAFEKDIKSIAALQSFWPPVAPETTVGSLESQAPGVQGRDVFGNAVDPDSGDYGLELSENLYRDKDNNIVSKIKGHVVVDQKRVDVTPVYILQNPAPGTLGDFEFDGAVLVQGDLTGPGSVRCGDIFITGKCEQINIKSSGDVFTGGGIIGRNNSCIESEGLVVASFISEARVNALGAVIAANALISSTVISNSEILVTAPNGAITGGSLYALRAISAAKIGSEFGMLTETNVGRDFLTPERLREICEAIQAQQDNLKKLRLLKEQIGKPGISLSKLASSKQELMISVMHSEQTAENQLKLLKKKEAELTSVQVEASGGSICAFDKIHPPLFIKIGENRLEINDDLGPVRFNCDKKDGISTEKYNVD